MANMILVSIMAKPWPTQFRGPAAKGMNRPGAKDLEENRSGLNSLTSLPHNSSLWWMARTGIHIDKPLGMWRSPSFMSSNAILGRTEAGGYSLSDSLITMFNCIAKKKNLGKFFVFKSKIHILVLRKSTFFKENREIWKRSIQSFNFFLLKIWLSTYSWLIELNFFKTAWNKVLQLIDGSVHVGGIRKWTVWSICLVVKNYVLIVALFCIIAKQKNIDETSFGFITSNHQDDQVGLEFSKIPPLHHFRRVFTRKFFFFLSANK